MQSKAATVDAYLASLPADRRAALSAVRAVMRANLDKDYEEGMQYGLAGYYVPHRIFPAGYHCDPSQPLLFAGFASQKNYMSIYLMGTYCGCGEDLDDLTPDARWFREAWARTGKKLDMGKTCLRFKKLEDLALDVIGEAIRRVPARLYVRRYQEIRSVLEKRTEKGPPRAKTGAKTGTKKKPAPGRRPASRAK